MSGSRDTDLDRDLGDGALREHLIDRAVDAALFGEMPSAEERLASRESGFGAGSGVDFGSDFAARFEAETEAFELVAARLATEVFAARGRGTEPMPEAVRARLAALATGVAAASAPAPIRLADRRAQLELDGARGRNPRSRTIRDWAVAAASIAFGATCTLLILEARTDRGEAGAVSAAAFEPDAFLRGHPGAVHWPWTSTGDAMSRGPVGGEAYFDPASGEGALVIDGLSPNDPTRAQYQLWIFDRARDERYPVDGGVFDVGADGRAVVPIRTQLAVREPYLFAVTVEKPGGVVVSERRIAILAKP
jgi:hypothetical protein